MVSFRDLKYFAHRLGDMFRWVGDVLSKVPAVGWAIAWPFYHVRNVFYERDYVFDALDSWVYRIAADARNAYNYALTAYSRARTALDWINSTGKYLSSQISNAVSMINALRNNLPSMIAAQVAIFRTEFFSAVNDLRDRFNALDAYTKDRINELNHLMMPAVLWERLSPDLVDKLIEELEKRW